MSKPRAYKLDNPDEVRRLLREVRGYLRVSLDHGTDREGREYALSGINELMSRTDPLAGSGGELLKFCRSFVGDFEMDFMYRGEICEDPNARWGQLESLYREAKAALISIETSQVQEESS